MGCASHIVAYFVIFMIPARISHTFPTANSRVGTDLRFILNAEVCNR